MVAYMTDVCGGMQRDRRRPNMVQKYEKFDKKTNIECRTELKGCEKMYEPPVCDAGFK